MSEDKPQYGERMLTRSQWQEANQVQNRVKQLVNCIQALVDAVTTNGWPSDECNCKQCVRIRVALSRAAELGIMAKESDEQA